MYCVNFFHTYQIFAVFSFCSMAAHLKLLLIFKLVASITKTIHLFDPITQFLHTCCHHSAFSAHKIFYSKLSVFSFFHCTAPSLLLRFIHTLLARKNKNVFSIFSSKSTVFSQVLYLKSVIQQNLQIQ